MKHGLFKRVCLCTWVYCGRSHVLGFSRTGRDQGRRSTGCRHHPTQAQQRSPGSSLGRLLKSSLRSGLSVGPMPVVLGLFGTSVRGFGEEVFLSSGICWMYPRLVEFRKNDCRNLEHRSVFSHFAEKLRRVSCIKGYLIIWVIYSSLNCA